MFRVEVLGSGSIPESRGIRDGSAAGRGRAAARNKARQRSKEKPNQQQRNIAIQKETAHGVPKPGLQSKIWANLTCSFTAIPLSRMKPRSASLELIS